MSSYNVDDVDGMITILQEASAKINGLSEIAKIDHHRLAKESGEDMPPACLLIVSDPSTNTPLLQKNPRVGLDLPLRFLAHFESSSTEVSCSFCHSNFLCVRHGMNDDNNKEGDNDGGDSTSSSTKQALKVYQDQLETVLQGIPKEQWSVVDTSSPLLTLNYGIVELTSKHNFETTEGKLRTAIMAQGDTVWFAEIDYQKEALELDAKSTMPKCKLLLFGAPTPGAKAMRKYTKLGLIAFCQKVLLVEEPDEDGSCVKILFNDIDAMNKLHYAPIRFFDLFATLPHKVINYRLKRTFEAAIA